MNILIDGIIILIIIINVNIIGLIDSIYKIFKGISFWIVKAKNNNSQFIDLIIIIIQRWNGGIPSLIISDKVNKMLLYSLINNGFEINENININDARIWIIKYRKINFLLFIFINVRVINIKLLISIINQIVIKFDKVSGIKADKNIIGIMKRFINKLILNLIFNYIRILTYKANVKSL